jgi:mRNA interferase RelE/StbE
MRYTLVYSKEALKELKRMDPSVARLLHAWLKKNIDGCEDPRIHGKALSNNMAGKWRYRIGDYRAICSIEDNIVTVIVLAVGHRSSIYR